MNRMKMTNSSFLWFATTWSSLVGHTLCVLRIGKNFSAVLSQSKIISKYFAAEGVIEYLKMNLEFCWIKKLAVYCQSLKSGFGIHCIIRFGKEDLLTGYSLKWKSILSDKHFCYSYRSSNPDQVELIVSWSITILHLHLLEFLMTSWKNKLNGGKILLWILFLILRMIHQGSFEEGANTCILSPQRPRKFWIFCGTCHLNPVNEYLTNPCSNPMAFWIV